MKKKNEKCNLRYKIIYLILDLILVFAFSFLSFLAFNNKTTIIEDIIPTLVYCATYAAITVICFISFGVYKIITKEMGLFESFKILLIFFLLSVICYFAVVLIPWFNAGWDYIYPWTLSTVALMFLLPSIRLLVRFLKLQSIMFHKTNTIKTLVIGAGATGKVVIDETRRNKDNKNQIVAVIDDDPNKIGGMLANIPVKGPIKDIAKIIDYTKAEEVIIAMSKISQDRLHEILGYLNTCNVRVRRMPLISEMEGPNDRKIIDVDLNDLLCREPVKLDNHEVLNMLHGKTVLVTGAGGSIGSELVRQIFNTHPKTLVLFDIYENSTYDIQMELVRKIREEKITDIELVTLIGSTYNETRVEQIVKKYKPDYIYHAAAYKHVPLMEDSPAEAIRTNVIGTYNVAKMADKYGVKKMVLVSTDKAVRPTNVMGATKRFAETIIQYFSSKSEHTVYAAVRFGNVLGSNGSVVPLFKKQIEAGGPVTITHKDIIRYFMTIPEAVSLILQCGLFAKGGEIFVLDMGKPVKIIDLAEKLIRQAGLVPYVDIAIVETGLRPGEKLFEELLLDTKHQIKTNNKKIFVESDSKKSKSINEEITLISKAFALEENDDIKKLLLKIVSSYTPKL